MEGRSGDAPGGQSDALEDLRDSADADTVRNDVNTAEMSSYQHCRALTAADGARLGVGHDRTQSDAFVDTTESSRSTIRDVVAALRAHGVSLLVSGDTE